MAILNSLFGGTAKRGLQNPFASMTSPLSGVAPRPLPAERTPAATWGGNPPTALPGGTASPYTPPPFTGILGNLMRGNFSQEGWPDWLKQVWNRGGA